MQFIMGSFGEAPSWDTDSTGTASSVDTQLIRWHLFKANLHVHACQGLSPRGSHSSVSTCPGASTCDSALEVAVSGNLGPLSPRSSMNHAPVGSAPYGSIAEAQEPCSLEPVVNLRDSAGLWQNLGAVDRKAFFATEQVHLSHHWTCCKCSSLSWSMIKLEACRH